MRSFSLRSRSSRGLPLLTPERWLFFSACELSCYHHTSGLLGGEGAHRLEDLLGLGHRDGLQRVGQPNARQVLASHELRRREQMVEELVYHAPDQMLAEVGDLGVFIYEERFPGLLDALSDQLPVVGPER